MVAHGAAWSVGLPSCGYALAQNEDGHEIKVKYENVGVVPCR